MKSYKVEIIPENKEDDIHKGLRILARIIAKQYLAQCDMTVSDADQLETNFTPEQPFEMAVPM